MSGIVVLGALHHDVVVDAPRLPRLDETLIGTGVDYRLGGKGGNQAVAAARLGGQVAMCGCVGQDEPGASMLATLGAAGVDTSGIVRSHLPTGMSVAITDADGSYGAVVVSGANREISGAEQLAFAAPSVALLQNEVPAAANRRFAARLPSDTILIWNAAPARDWDGELAGRTDILVVNRVEALDLTGQEDPETAAALLLERVAGAVIVTRGAQGLILGRQDHEILRLPAKGVDIVSTHGAGDMFCGALATVLAEGGDLATAAAFATCAAGLFVASPIADRAAITREKVEAKLRS